MDEGSKGFSLVELLIVVAIILVIAAIAIPNFMRSKVAANQSSAVASLHVLEVAEVTYSTTYGSGFSASMQYLAPGTPGANPNSTAAWLIDSVLASGAKSGYVFTYSPGPVDSSGRITTFTFTAVPQNSATGINHYYIDQAGVIRQNATTNASSTDSPVGS